MNERNRLLQAISTIIKDYQEGIIATPTPEHVERWINQFPTDVQQPILAEMEYVLARTYFSKVHINSLLNQLVYHKDWTGTDKTAFWLQMNFLNIQPRGNSQHELLLLFYENLQKELGIHACQCGQSNKYIYIDDGLFSGNRLDSDLTTWILEEAPYGAELYIAFIAIHTQGFFFKKKSLEKANVQSRKNITIYWDGVIFIEDGLYRTNTSDVLRPMGPGTDPDVEAYVASLGSTPVWRSGTNIGPQRFFSSNQGKDLLEQAFLKQGVAVRAMCPYLINHQRPLGNTTMKTVGFGTMFATYRNCPNNAPLVLWAGNPWYPLLPRITN